VGGVSVVPRKAIATASAKVVMAVVLGMVHSLDGNGV
jgi:hypothetical protein